MQLSQNNQPQLQTKTEPNKKVKQNKLKHYVDLLSFSGIYSWSLFFISVQELIWPSLPIFSSDEKREDKVTGGDSTVSD